MKTKINRDLDRAKMHFWSNWLGSMAWTTENGVNFDFSVQFDHVSQG